MKDEGKELPALNFQVPSPLSPDTSPLSKGITSNSPQKADSNPTLWYLFIYIFSSNYISTHQQYDDVINNQFGLTPQQYLKNLPQPDDRDLMLNLDSTEGSPHAFSPLHYPSIYIYIYIYRNRRSSSEEPKQEIKP